MRANFRSDVADSLRYTRRRANRNRVSAGRCRWNTRCGTSLDTTASFGITCDDTDLVKIEVVEKTRGDMPALSTSGVSRFVKFWPWHDGYTSSYKL